jgi:hypothetical protein
MNNRIDFLEKEIAELRESRKAMKELGATMEEAHNSSPRMETLQNSSQEFYTEYGESVFLTETIRDKIFLSMSNLYFLNLYRGMQVDFNESFPIGQILDFKDIFPARVAAAKHEIYFAQEQGMNM